MRRFIGYRPNPPKEYFEQGAANAPDEPQYEGVVFSDGTVAVRWLTKWNSWSIWEDWERFYNIHGHPEYGTIIKWLDEIKVKDVLKPPQCPLGHDGINTVCSQCPKKNT